MDIARGVDGEERGIDGKDQGVNDTTQGEDDENCEAYSDSKLRNAADWDEWDEAFGCWLAKFSDCRKWLIDGLRPVYEIKEFVPRIAADGRVAMVAGEPIMVPNPLYAGDEGMDKRWEDLDKCEERTEELRVLAARAIGKIWSTASERLRRKIKQQEGYKVAFVSDDLLWYYNVMKKTFDWSRHLVVEGRPVQSAADLLRMLMELKIEGSGSQALYAYTSQFERIWRTVLRLGMTSEDIVKSWRNICLVKPIWLHPKFERAAEDIILGDQWPQLEQLLTRLSLTCGELLDAERHVDYRLSKASIDQVTGKRKKHHQATCHHCGRVGHIKRDCDLAEPRVRSQTRGADGDSGGSRVAHSHRGRGTSGGGNGCGDSGSDNGGDGGDADGGSDTRGDDGDESSHRVGDSKSDSSPRDDRDNDSGPRVSSSGGGRSRNKHDESSGRNRKGDESGRSSQRTDGKGGRVGDSEERRDGGDKGVRVGDSDGEGRRFGYSDGKGRRVGDGSSKRIGVNTEVKTQKWKHMRKFGHSPRAIVGSLKSKEEREEATLQRNQGDVISGELRAGQDGSHAVKGGRRVSNVARSAHLTDNDDEDRDESVSVEDLIEARSGRFIDHNSDEDNSESSSQYCIEETDGYFVRMFLTTTKTVSNVLGKEAQVWLTAGVHGWKTLVPQSTTAFVLTLCVLLNLFMPCCCEIACVVFVTTCFLLLCRRVLCVLDRHACDVGSHVRRWISERKSGTSIE